MRKLLTLLIVVCSIGIIKGSYDLTERNVGKFRMITIDTHALSLKNDTIGDRTYAVPSSESSMGFSLTQGNLLDNDSILLYKLTICLNTRSNYTFYSVLEGSRLLLKLNTGENLTLRCDESSSIRRGGAWGNFIMMPYDISKEQIEEIINSGGISKMRIEFTNSPEDYYFKNNQLGKFFINGMEQIKQAMETNTFEKGF